MKRKHKSLLFLSLGVFSLTLSGCSFKDIGDWFKSIFGGQKAPLVIPTVDVTSLQVNLPELPTRNVGEIRSDSEYEYIDLYELSDFHGAVNYEPDHSSGAYIGLPKLASYLDSKRVDNAGGTLVLSTGDMFQGSADSNLTRGFMVNYCMQYMGFDAMAVGNHEFDWTDEWLQKNAELKYNTSAPGIPYLGANVTKSGVLPSFLQKSTVVQRGEYKIGIIGVIGGDLEDTILKSAIPNYDFSKYATIVNEESARLRNEEHCNAVVLLAHEAADQLEVLATGSVQAAFGGHAHQNVPDATVAGAPAIATKNYGQSVAHIALKFNKTSKEFVGTDGVGITEMSTIGSSLEENADIKKIMNEFAPAIDQIKNIKLGTADAELAFDKAVKNICTKSMFDAAVKSASEVAEIDQNRIVCSFHNVNGGIRDDIAAGDITYGSVYKAFPFDNEIVLIKVNGQDFCEKVKLLNTIGIYRIFEKRDYFVMSEDYYIATTDYVALSTYFTNVGWTFEDKDLIRTGKVVRDIVAEKIYEIDKVKNEEWSANTVNFRPVSISF